MGGYARSRTGVPLRRVLLLMMLATQMFALLVLVIWQFVMRREADGARQLLGPGDRVALTVPPPIRVLRRFLLGIPAGSSPRLEGVRGVGQAVRARVRPARQGLSRTSTAPCRGCGAGARPPYASAYEEGIDDPWIWGFESCGHMSALTPDDPAVWAATVEATLAGARR